MCKKILPFIFCVLPFLAVSQNIEFDKKNFSDKAGLKEAIMEIKIGDAYYGRSIYSSALEHYLKANEFNPDNADLNLKMGHCYLYSDNRDKAIPLLEKSLKLDKGNPKIHYSLGLAYHLNMEWDKAIKEYTIYSKIPQEAKLAKKKIMECKAGKELAKDPVKVAIENMGDAINTEFPEYAPLISADESVLIFTSRRPTTTGEAKDNAIDDYFEDIYISYKKDGKWLPVENIGIPVNSEKHDGTVYLSPDGQKLYVYRDDNGDGNIYECILDGTQWSAPQKLSSEINSKYQEPSATFSPDGKIIYFVSNNPANSLGGKDIYMSSTDDKGKWSSPVNLGPTINTALDEDGVFMHPDGKTLYFSSQGHNTMGGYDIFKSVFEKGKWKKPQNLGYPINTPDEDIFFSISADGKHGYYSSVQVNGRGSKDLYRISWVMEKQDTITPELTILKGIITDQINGKPIKALIEIVDNQKNEVISKFESNSSSGKYLLSLPSGRNYGISVTAEGYLFHSENVNIPESKGYQKITKDIGLKKLTVGSKIVLNNIFFDYDKSTIRSESAAELERLIKLMQDNSKVAIELSGHTDNKGSAEYNQKLSEERAKAVVDYLTKKGIAEKRLKYAGYGFTRPIATNDTEEGRQLNRRTEFEVLSN